MGLPPKKKTKRVRKTIARMKRQVKIARLPDFERLFPWGGFLFSPGPLVGNNKQTLKFKQTLLGNVTAHWKSVDSRLDELARCIYHFRGHLGHEGGLEVVCKHAVVKISWLKNQDCVTSGHIAVFMAKLFIDRARALTNIAAEMEINRERSRGGWHTATYGMMRHMEGIVPELSPKEKYPNLEG